MVTEEERYSETVKVWEKATNDVAKNLEDNFKNFDKFNPIWMMADSGARGSMQQIKQLSGMRGLMSDPNGKVIEIPVKSSFREGLSVLEYFISSHGARKGGADTALKTADSGYLTRRLVDVAHDVIVKEDDCGDTRGFEVKALSDSAGAVIEPLKERIAGRFSINAIVDPATGEELVAADSLISEDDAARIEKAGIESVRIRSVLTCKAKSGICAKCYGANMSSWNKVKVGEAVGIIAAQSIGEPGTQLTMRTFHTGGIATNTDITQGLPRVEELFEARDPKGKATVASITGDVTVEPTANNSMNLVKIENAGQGTYAEFKIPVGAKLLVKTGDHVEAGDPLMVGSIYPQDTLRTKGVQGVQESMIREVQSAYRSNGVNIQDKHIEVIVRQMLRKVRIIEPNDTNFILNEVVDLHKMEEENERVLEQGGIPASAKRILLGITKSSLATESFLSAASFQETTRVLVDAAIRSKVDHFTGLKENVIIGKLIPAGTGMKLYRNVTIEAADDRFQKQPTEVEEPLFIDDYDDSDIADNAATDDKKA